jgi:hypothetical protein
VFCSEELNKIKNILTKLRRSVFNYNYKPCTDPFDGYMFFYNVKFRNNGRKARKLAASLALTRSLGVGEPGEGRENFQAGMLAL